MSYFEFEDVKRFHQPYTDAQYRQPHWKSAPYQKLDKNWLRGLYCASYGVLLVEPLAHFRANAISLNHFYEWPRTKMEYNIFYREVFRMPEFWPELFKKISFGMISSGGDIAVKLAVFQKIYGGTSSPAEYADWNSFKPFVCSVLAALPVCWTGVPFENARRAYYADRTWPVELRRGYTSPFNALWRIPFEEGPAYLFKGGFPIMSSQFFFWTGFGTMYPWLKNKTAFFWVYNDFPYNWVKFVNFNIAFWGALLMSYPCYYTREMVDLWPKERGGHCTFNNSYRQALKFMITNIDMHYYNFFPGFWRYMMRYGWHMAVTLWIADSAGMLDNNMEGWNSMEQLQPIQAEAV